jgi:hypothetical protein
MKKLIYFSFSFLFFFLFSQCGEYTDCSGWVGNKFRIALYDTQTKTLGKAYFYKVSISDGESGFWQEVPRQDRLTNNEKYYPPSDTMNFHYLEFNKNSAYFGKEGKLNAIISIDGEEKCTLEINLIANEQCDGYPETGIITILKGKARFSSKDGGSMTSGRIPLIVIDK